MITTDLVPESPLDLGLPHDEWRQHQREAVEAVLQGFETGTKVMLSAPTGSGKTAIGSAAARVLRGSAMFLSHTKHLQRQQLRTLPDAVTATGRGNHPCALPDVFSQHLTADEAPCPCDLAPTGECSYYRQYIECEQAKEVVLNYSYAVRVCKSRGIRLAKDDVIPNPFKNRSLLVCDEGHFLERALIDADTIDVFPRTFEKLGVHLPDSLCLEDWTHWAEDCIHSLGSRVSQAVKLVLTKEHPHRDELREAKRLRSANDAALDIIAAAKKGVPYHVGRTQSGYRIQPLWAWGTAHHLLFQYSPRTLIMSATLGDPALLARLLGMQPDDWVHIEVPSSFPVENRPVIYWPVVRMNMNTPVSEKVRQAVALIQLARKFPNVPGVVHCASYPLQQFLRDAVCKLDHATADRLTLHDSKDRDAVFHQFEQCPENKILISPSATTGVDWDFVWWQMIPKVPFPDLGDDITRLRFEYVTEEGEPIGKKVYAQEAALAVVQASGRNVRTETSKGVAVITDTAFWPLFKYTSPGSFPSWFREAVQYRSSL